MKKNPKIHSKFTKALLNLINSQGRTNPIEAIVRIKDPVGISRLIDSDLDINDKIQTEMEHYEQISVSLIYKLKQFQKENPEIKIIDKSWLTNSVLLEASLEALIKIAELEEIDLIDTNKEILGAF